MEFRRKRGFYEKYIKRILDVICSLLVIIVFFWLYLMIALIVKSKMGSPVIFKQPRPGMVDPKTGRERIFFMYKFRTMSEERGDDGELMPDEQRLSAFGAMLRSTSLDELPEFFNILKGDMSVIGPRPQLVCDMVFMSEKQRMRHTAKPGLSGLAQVSGRNAIAWEKKFELDNEYIHHVSLWNDLKILWMTVLKVFGRNESSAELAVTDDYGDWLLNTGRISQIEYDCKHSEAKTLLEHRFLMG